MVDGQPTLESLVAELAQMRAILASQHETIARQEAAISALQNKLEATDNHHSPHATDTLSSADDSHAGNTHGFTTSRRGLIRGAAAATAAATVGAVTLGAGQSAHAAPLADGSNLVLGQSNSAASTTTLSDSAGTATDMLVVVSTSTSATAAAIAGQAAQQAIGVSGVATTGAGVKGSASNAGGLGVWGQTSAGTGVYGRDDTNGTGVEGYSATNIGVYGTGGSGSWGVVGNSADSLDLVAGGTGLIMQLLQKKAGAPSGTFAGGESIRDSNGDLWLCMAGGTPGTWVKVAHPVAGLTGGAVTYLSKPIRLLDTRPGAAAANHPGAPYAAGSTHTIQVAGVTYNTVQVPASCAGAIGNLTVIGDVGNGGYAALVPSGVGFTGTANLTFNAGQVVSNAYNVGLSSGGALDIILGPAASADVILDLFAIVS